MALSLSPSVEQTSLMKHGERFFVSRKKALGLPIYEGREANDSIAYFFEVKSLAILSGSLNQ